MRESVLQHRSKDMELSSLSIALNIIRRKMGSVDWRLAYIIARCIHSVGDPLIIKHLRFSPNITSIIEGACKSIRRVVVDVEMAYSGIASRCRALGIETEVAIRHARRKDMRVADGLEKLVDEGLIDECTVLVNGNAPSFLEVAINAILSGKARPLLIIATPPGFVKAPSVKARLLSLNTPYMTTIGSRGGSPIASAMFNAVVDVCTGRAWEALQRLGYVHC